MNTTENTNPPISFPLPNTEQSHEDVPTYPYEIKKNLQHNDKRSMHCVNNQQTALIKLSIFDVIR